MSKFEALGWIVAQSTDPGRWKTYGEEVLGMSSTPVGEGLGLKMDARDYRILVVPGAEDRYFASGWEVADAAALADVRAALEGAGVAVTEEAAEVAASRNMSALLSFVDPAGNRHEVGHGYSGGDAPFVSPIGVSGFVTGAQGMGHTVLPALPFDETYTLFTEVLGFGVSDEFDFQPGPDAPVMRIRFLHCNPRHHSLALAEMPNPAGCVHMMVEVDSMTEVGKAHDRRVQHDVKLMATLGQHTNDSMTSFYMMTPGQFALEYGWGGATVDPATHQTTQSPAPSVWGHDFSVGFS